MIPFAIVRGVGSSSDRYISLTLLWVSMVVCLLAPALIQVKLISG